MHDTLQLRSRQVDMVSFIPLQQLLLGLIAAEAHQTKLRGEPDRAIVAKARFDMTFPDFLRSGAAKLGS